MGREARVAAGRMQQGAMAGRAPADARVAAMLARHGGALMRVARQWSLCHDDALDAFQRGLEIFVRRMDTVHPATEAAWLKVVIRHEAMAIRRSRSDCVADPDLDLEAVIPAEQRSVEEQVLSGDRLSRSAEALRALKPDEARALMLKAHGMSYEEIGRHCGWTYTKVNRAITEGRRRFMQVYAALEDGAECERFAPLLRGLVDGTATSEELVELRPHLRRCQACRATVRDLHRGGLRVLVPLPAIAAALEWVRERLGRGRGLPSELHELLTRVPRESTAHHVAVNHAHAVHGAAVRAVPALDPSAPGAAALEATASAPGSLEEKVGALERLKQQLLALTERFNSSDLAASIHIATTTGGGRISTLGAIVGLCLSGVGAGTVCLVTGVLDLPLGHAHTPHRTVVRHAPKHDAPLPARAGRPLSTELVAARPVPTPTPTPTVAPRAVRHVHRARRHPSPTPVPARIDPSQGTAPTSQESAPISPAPTQPAAEEFAAAPAAGTGTKPAPAPAPATGGGEFTP